MGTYLTKRRKRFLLVLVVIAVPCVIWLRWGRLGSPSGRPTFDGASSELTRTQIVATLDAPILKGKNAIWCASFQTAWKTLQDDLLREPVKLQGNPELARVLNSAEDIRSEVPAGCLYTVSGMAQDGVIQKIQSDIKSRFPRKEPPQFPGIARNSFVSYSYLEARVKFPLPYFQNRKPLQFRDASGAITNVTSFGIREEDEYEYYRLREQPRVLFCDDRFLPDRDFTFALDLCGRSNPSQIVVACIPRKGNLAEAVFFVENHRKTRSRERPGPTDWLLVPDMVWRLSHRFTEIERGFQNAKLRDQRMDLAQQDISFRLDRSGAELSSQVRLECMPKANHYVLDRPFLIYMKKRGAKQPYFAMWVDNAELLKAWK